MRKWLLILPVLMLFACAERDDIVVLEEDPYMEEDLLFRPGIMVVKVTPGLSASIEGLSGVGGLVNPSLIPELKEVAGTIGMESMERLFMPAGAFEERSRSEGLHLWYQLSFDKSFSIGKAKELMAAHPGITVVECDPMRRLYADDIV